MAGIEIETQPVWLVVTQDCDSGTIGIKNESLSIRWPLAQPRNFLDATKAAAQLFEELPRLSQSQIPLLLNKLGHKGA